MSTPIRIIVAMSTNGVIGRAGGLPWGKLVADLKRFRDLTMGHVVVMGRKTWDSLPTEYKPLPGRTNVVITTRDANDFPSHPDLRVSTLSAFRQSLSHFSTDKSIFIIGGAQLYQEFIPMAETIHLTHVDKTINDGDTLFPDIPAYYSLTDIGEKLQEEASGLSYRFLTYTRPLSDECAYHQEWTYLDLARRVLELGKPRPDRTGTGTLSLFGGQMRFDISKSVPLLTTKRVPWKSCIEELLWFLRGDTDAKILQRKKVHIWDGNSTRAFMDNVGLTHLEEGDCGANYSFQWRHFGARYVDCHTNYTGQGVDQVESVLNLLRTDPFSRRIFLSAWNPSDLKKTVLPPCHVSCQFYVEEDAEGQRHLSCHMYQRSCDLFLGEPWNMLSYSILTYILAAKANMKPKDIIISMGDIHVYANHVDAVKQQLQRKVRAQPVLLLSKSVEEKSWEELSVDDFDMVGYFPNPAIRAEMAV